MDNTVKLEKPLAIIYDRSKLFFLKRLINSFVEANPVLKPLQADVSHMLRTVKNEQARGLSIYTLMKETEDPLIIQLLGMHLDAIKYEKRA